MKKLTFFLIILISLQSFAQTNYTINPTAPNEIYITNASGKGWKGGDTLNIPAGNYSVIEIDSFGGDSQKDIIVRNSGGLVNVNGPIRFGKDVHYVKVQGNGVSNIKYGFRTNIFAFNRVNHFTVEQVEIHDNKNGVGIYGKQDPYITQSATQYPNYVNRKITINNNYIHNVEGEGMYIGDTAPNADPYNNNLIPQRGDSITISNNIVDSTGWDGIQLSNARNACLIFGNTVTNFGLKDLDSQRAGIISGGNTNTQVYNNTVSNGTGNGIQFFGYGDMYCYNNTISNVGNTLRNVNGEENIYARGYINKVESNPKLNLIIHDNLFTNPKKQGAIRINNEDFNTLPANIYNNKFCFTVAPPTNWQQIYFIVSPAGYTNINNTLSCSVILPPVDTLPKPIIILYDNGTWKKN